MPADLTIPDPLENYLNTASAALASGQNAANAAATAMGEVLALQAAGNYADQTDLWPVQNWSKPARMLLAGPPQIEKWMHPAFEQGRFLERSIGDATSKIAGKKADLDEKIQQWLGLNRLALDGQLPQLARVPKYVADSLKFVQQIRTYTQRIAGLLQALEANVAALQAVQGAMSNMIAANMNALANLLNEICNWGLPSLPSMPVQLAQMWHWNGFNFNSASGFAFADIPYGQFAQFSFTQCKNRLLQGAGLGFLLNGPRSASDGGLTYSLASAPAAPESGSYADSARYTDPDYIAEMQADTSPIFDPSEPAALGSLPNPAAIVSNYSLPAATYIANIVAAVPSLAPVVIQLGDADYGQSAPAPARLSRLRGLLIKYVNLGTIAASGYDANLMAAWLLALDANRTGRGGQWLANFQTAFDTLVALSVGYICAASGSAASSRRRLS